jgi:hypothetical protein
MSSLKQILFVLAVIAFAGGSVWLYAAMTDAPKDVTDMQGGPQTVTISGTYLCLPRTDGAQNPDDCRFGLQADDGTFYAVNFGQSASAMDQFRRNEHINAEGFLTPKMALSSDQWAAYDFDSVFTFTRMLAPAGTPAAAGKLDINAICDGALAYMTFADGAAAAKFVADCKEGTHPEVIEKYKKDMQLGDGAAI